VRYSFKRESDSVENFIFIVKSAHFTYVSYGIMKKFSNCGIFLKLSCCSCHIIWLKILQKWNILVNKCCNFINNSKNWNFSFSVTWYSLACFRSSWTVLMKIWKFRAYVMFDCLYQIRYQNPPCYNEHLLRNDLVFAVLVLEVESSRLAPELRKWLRSDHAWYLHGGRPTSTTNMHRSDKY